MYLINQSTGAVIASQVEIADTWWKRFVGLMFRKHIMPDYALMLTPCNSIHMFFMRFPIGVIYLDNNYKVIWSGILKPWQIGPISLKTNSVLECSTMIPLPVPGTQLIVANNVIGDASKYLGAIGL